MSKLKVEVVTIDDIVAHTNADLLELAIIKGWQVVVQKGVFKKGDKVVYFPLDSVLALPLSDNMGVTKYLGSGNRIKAAKLRGEPSYGTIAPVDSIESYLRVLCGRDTLKVTDYIDSETDEVNLTACLGVEKWEPPCNSQDEEVPHTLFDKYTDIDNMRNYPNIIEEGEEVVITEKIHGSNARYAYIDGEFMVGSHNIRIKENTQNKFWSVVSPELKNALQQLGTDGAPVIAYGELYGSGIQDLTYGLANNNKKVRLFDISVNCNYLDYGDFDSVCSAGNIEVAPVLYRGPFSMEKVLSFSTSESTLGGNMMEGVVIRPVKERRHPKIGRVILKYVFDQYLLRPNGTENH